MRYNTKQLFQNAAQVVASEFGNLYSEGEEVPRRKPSGPFEDTPERASRRPGAKDKSIKQQIKEAFIEAGVDKLALQQQVIDLQEIKIKELEFDCAMLQRQLFDLGNRFNKFTSKNFKKPFAKKNR